MKAISSLKEYKEQYKFSVEHPEQFWDSVASQFMWKQKWDKTLEWNFEEPEVKWFINGKLNISENCIDRHLPQKAKDTAFIWESNFEDKPDRVITYQQLHDEVCRLA